MAQKLGYQGGSGGQLWDDGAFTGVRKIYFTIYSNDIIFLKVDYDQNGQVVTREHGQRKGYETEFVLDYPGEYITSVEGSYDPVPGQYKINIVKSLIFKTSKGRTSPTFGRVFNDKFVLESAGLALVGFHGRAGVHIDALGAYFGPPPRPSPSPIEKLQAQGGSGGEIWDDGVFTGVRKIYFTIYSNDIMFLKVDYDQNGQVVTREHGQRKGYETEFALDYPSEYITSVEGSYDPVPGQYKINIVKSLIFKTSKGRTSPTFGRVFNDKFVLERAGLALVGFHGRAGVHIDALGAYFGPPPLPPPSPIEKLQEKGGSGGQLWDDGAFTGVRKISFTIYSNDIMFLKVDYDQNGQVVSREHGQRKGYETEFALDYPSEFITSVEGSYDPVPGQYKINIVKSLIFKTSKGRTSPTFGRVFNDKFVLERAGLALVGFHGRAGVHIDALGAYFGPPRLPPPPPAEKLQGKGGDGGVSWDDGAFQGVKKIYVGQGENGVAAVKFEYYDKSNQVVVGGDHGKVTRLGYEPFVLDYPSEYITAVEGCYDKIFGSESEVITMLKFKTNKKTSPPFGLETTSTFVLAKEGYKIVGFHGKASHELHQFGVTVAPITK